VDAKTLGIRNKLCKAGAHQLRYFEGWFKQLVFAYGPEAAAQRERAFAMWKEDSTRSLGVVMSDPDITLVETAQHRYFGEA
jgi:hypothetical protein